MEAKIVSIINNKGGVGKTTSSAFLGEVLSFFGKKTLLIDMDESANLSVLFGKYSNDSSNVVNGIELPEFQNISEIFKFRYQEKEQVAACISSVSNRLDIIPSSKRHGNTPSILSQNKIANNNIVLKRALKTLRDEYDFIIIDTAPANDVLIINSLIASDYILVPVRSEGFSYKGLNETLETISYLKAEYDINAAFLGAFVTAAEKNTNVFKEFEREYRTTLKEKYLPCIRKDVKVNELLTNCENIIEYAANSTVLYDYCMLLLETGILDDDTANLIRAAYQN